MENQQELRIKKLREVNSILVKSTFAHHPNCSEYDHHVIRINDWRFCLGCTGMYSGIVLIAMFDLFVLQNLLSITSWISFGIGLILFLPAMAQLFLKSEHRGLRFAFRFSLGLSIYFLVKFIITVRPIWIQIPAAIFFLLGVWYYSRYQGSRQLRECTHCRLGEEYDTCLTKYQALIPVENLEIIETKIPQVRDFLELKTSREEES